MSGIYIHIPFCKQACNYCNFHFSTNLSNMEALKNAMLQEIHNKKNYLPQQPLQTVYFGGGTPSIFPIEYLQDIWNALESNFDLSQLKEVTLEANPDDLTSAKLKELKSLPINRLSIGIQSFKQDDLQFMHRAHNAKEAINSIELAQQNGFSNISADLIYGTPGLTDEEWIFNIDKLIQQKIPHISAYALTVEPKTLLAKQISQNKKLSPTEEQSARQFKILLKVLQSNGYEQYEISNFAIPGHHAIHNTNYWKGEMYLGIGPAAHSFNGAERSWNIANNALYIKSIQENGFPQFEIERLTIENRINEYIMTSLRTKWGLDLIYFASTFLQEATDALLKKAQIYLDSNHINKVEQKLILTTSGKLLADKISVDLFA